MVAATAAPPPASAPVVAWPRAARDLPVIAALAPPRRKPFGRQAPIGPDWAKGLYANGLVYADMEDPTSDYTRAVMALRATLRGAEASGRSRIVAVGSSEAANLATLTSVNIALAAAASGERVLLVDASRTASLSQLAVPKMQTALDDVLSGTASLAEALLRDPLTGIHLLPGRGIVMATRDILLRDLSHVVPLYDLILLDAGRLSPSMPPLAAVEAADDLVLVVPAGASADTAQRIVSDQRKFRGMVTVADAA
jgi:polysaccharide biosynthesis transport protein